GFGARMERRETAMFFMPQIHPTAFVDPAAELADDVAIGSFAVIEADTRLAARVRVEAHAQVLRGTSIGAGTRVGRGAILGEAPQDKSIDPDLPSGVIIGEDNVLREH